MKKTIKINRNRIEIAKSFSPFKKIYDLVKLMIFITFDF